MTISHERRKAQIKKFRKPLIAHKADCFRKRCHEIVAVYRHVAGETVPLCYEDDRKFREMRKKELARSLEDVRKCL